MRGEGKRMSAEKRVEVEVKGLSDFDKVWRQARALASVLKEDSKPAQSTIRRVIITCGLDFTKDITRQAREVILGDGMLTNDGARKRTFGGVFFKLCKESMTVEQRGKVFYPGRWQKLQAKRAAAKAAEEASEVAE